MIKIMVFWVMVPCSKVETYHVSEEAATSIFRSEDFSEMLVSYQTTQHHIWDTEILIFT
jgi:hypothetical protein